MKLFTRSIRFQVAKGDAKLFGSTREREGTDHEFPSCCQQFILLNGKTVCMVHHCP